MTALAAASPAGMELSAYHCPTWAFDPLRRDLRPRTGGKWQPMWVYPHRRSPKPGFEAFVYELLQDLAVALYEPLRVALPAGKPLRGAGRRVRRYMCNDFFLPEYNLMIEIYSGRSTQMADRKRGRMKRMHRMTGIRYMLLTPRQWDLLKVNPALLATWIDQVLNAA